MKSISRSFNASPHSLSFDDIFDSTRYVKALEELKEQKKKYMAKVKDHKTDLAKLEAHKHASLGLRMDLDTVCNFCFIMD